MTEILCEKNGRRIVAKRQPCVWSDFEKTIFDIIITNEDFGKDLHIFPKIENADNQND